MKNTIVIILLTLSTLAFAQSEQEKNVYTRVNKNTFFIISAKTQMVSTGDLELHSSISGKGAIKFIDNNDIILDANKHSIENLVIIKGENSRTNIYSTLKINQSLHLIRGKLALYDFDIILGEYARLIQEKEGQIVFMGDGQIHYKREANIIAHSLPTIDFQTIALSLHYTNSIFPTKKLILYESKNKIEYFSKKPPISPA